MVKRSKYILKCHHIIERDKYMVKLVKYTNKLKMGEI